MPPPGAGKTNFTIAGPARLIHVRTTHVSCH